MMENLVPVLMESLFSFLKVSGLILLIVTPIVAIMDRFRDSYFSRVMGGPLQKTFFWMPIRKESILALFVGLIFGIAYGGGVLMEEARSGALNKKDAFLVALFLSLCHAMIEDTMIFLAIGANPLVIIGFRILFTICVVSGFVLILGRRSLR